MSYPGHKSARAPGYRETQIDQVWPLHLAKSKGREMSSDEISKEFISMRPTQGREQTRISKTVS